MNHSLLVHLQASSESPFPGCQVTARPAAESGFLIPLLEAQLGSCVPQRLVPSAAAYHRLLCELGFQVFLVGLLGYIKGLTGKTFNCLACDGLESDS